MLIDYPNLNKVFSSIDECHTLTEKQALQLLQVTGIQMSCPEACLHRAKLTSVLAFAFTNACTNHVLVLSETKYHKLRPLINVASCFQISMRSLQICRWEFLAFSGTFKTLLNVHEERDAGRVVFSLIKSSFMKDFEGQWQVKHPFKNAMCTLSDSMWRTVPYCMSCVGHLCNHSFWMQLGHACYHAPALHIIAINQCTITIVVLTSRHMVCVSMAVFCCNGSLCACQAGSVSILQST